MKRCGLLPFIIALPLNLIAAEFPLEALPAHITLDLPYGERPDWAPTGSDTYVFLDAPGGKPFEKNRITGELRSILPPDCEDCKVWRVYYLSNRHAYYDEPEGIFPDGEYTLVECDMFLAVSQHAQVLDLYRMKVDGTGKDMLRLTQTFWDAVLFRGLQDAGQRRQLQSESGRGQ